MPMHSCSFHAERASWKTALRWSTSASADLRGFGEAVSVPPGRAARTGVRPGYAIAPIASAIDAPCVLASERPARPDDEHRFRQTLLLGVSRLRPAGAVRRQPACGRAVPGPATAAHC